LAEASTAPSTEAGSEAGYAALSVADEIADGLADGIWITCGARWPGAGKIVGAGGGLEKKNLSMPAAGGSAAAELTAAFGEPEPETEDSGCNESFRALVSFAGGFKLETRSVGAAASGLGDTAGLGAGAWVTAAGT
jgi:hypothetical protein